MNHYEPGISYPRRRDDWMRDHPLASRLLIMIVGFAVLVPIGLVIRASQGNVVRSGGLPGAALAADPLVVASSTSTSAAGAAAAGAAPTTVATVAPSSAASVVPQTSPPVTGASVDQVPSTAAKKKTTTTTATPTTTAAKKAATAAPAPKPTSPPTTKAAPATTDPPTTPPTTEAVVAPPPNTYSKADVEAIIRSVFPAEAADEAVRIATRESNLVPTVRNWCCYGLFQIYFKMNKKTLAAIGVTTPEQLYDPVVNTQAAYLIFQRSGWAPWE
jgi:hypothetical protein